MREDVTLQLATEKDAELIHQMKYEAFLPLIAVAIIYLILVMLLSFGANKLERKLRNNER